MNVCNRLLGCKSIAVSALLLDAQLPHPVNVVAATPLAKQVVGCGEMNSEEIIDNRIMRKLDETGFIDRTYAAHGASLK